MTQEEIVRQLQGSQQALQAIMAQEKEAEIKLRDAHEARLQKEGELSVWQGLFQLLIQQGQEGKNDG
jgi:hypothetical protein